MKNVLVIVVFATAVAAALASVGSAQRVASSLACPPNPKTQPLGKIYGANRGTSFCNDGAKATALVRKVRINVTGGVCWKSKDSFNVGIGTVVAGRRKKSDPPGMWLIDVKPGNIVGDTVDLGKGTIDWTGPVKVKLTGKTGTFNSTSLGTSVNGKLTGSFTCKRVLDAPDQ
jgi:hypothetical protein